MASEREEIIKALRGVNFDEHRRGGEPVLDGTRFPAAQVLAELAAGRSVDELAKDYDLYDGPMRELLRSLADYVRLLRVMKEAT
jgi:uncharacterized protein (DUF433 family)